MKTKVLAALAAAVVAAGVLVPLLTLGGGRPTPEQVCQSLVPQHLTWHDVRGVETAKDPARAMEFQVSSRYVTVSIDTASPVFKTDGNEDLAAAGLFFDHYATLRGTTQAMFALSGFIGYLQVYGPYIFQGTNGQLLQQVFVPVAHIRGHSLYIGASATGDYLFRVSR